MTRKNLLVASLSLCLLTYAAGTAQATSGIKNNWKSRYTTACATLRTAADHCLICHTVPDNGADIDNLNGYGLLLMNNNRNFAAAESADSDTDGRTNLQEIMTDCTNPGDATSPTDEATWGTMKSIYR
jgi:hypothetical protein